MKPPQERQTDRQTGITTGTENKSKAKRQEKHFRGRQAQGTSEVRVPKIGKTPGLPDTSHSVCRRVEHHSWLPPVRDPHNTQLEEKQKEK